MQKLYKHQNNNCGQWSSHPASHSRNRSGRAVQRYERISNAYDVMVDDYILFGL